MTFVSILQINTETQKDKDTHWLSLGTVRTTGFAANAPTGFISHSLHSLGVASIIQHAYFYHRKIRVQRNGDLPKVTQQEGNEAES